MSSTTSLPESRTDSPTTTRAERALKLFEERGQDIRCISAGVYRVPSCSGSYDVLYGKREECPCPDYLYGGGRACKHLLAVGIMHAARRSGVAVRTLPAVVAGDPFAHAGKRRECTACFGGYVILTMEEDGQEHEEAVSCRRCSPRRPRPYV
jgi:hypothetical protein